VVVELIHLGKGGVPVLIAGIIPEDLGSLLGMPTLPDVSECFE
jgi:hypothetical protein